MDFCPCFPHEGSSKPDSQEKIIGRMPSYFTLNVYPDSYQKVRNIQSCQAQGLQKKPILPSARATIELGQLKPNKNYALTSS